jgi:radical SAM superfamily enzyme with C-terminal helix-hairpin-helix motif
MVSVSVRTQQLVLCQCSDMTCSAVRRAALFCRVRTYKARMRHICRHSMLSRALPRVSVRRALVFEVSSGGTCWMECCLGTDC